MLCKIVYSIEKITLALPSGALERNFGPILALLTARQMGVPPNFFRSFDRVDAFT